VAAPAASSGSEVLGTSDQLEVESTALRLLETSEVREAAEALRRQMLADPTAATVDGAATLDNALDEIAFMACLGAANSDPQRPKVVWYFTAPRYWHRHHVPGSRWGLDTPDNVYRHVIIDAESSYEIRVQQRSPAPTQFSFMIYDSYSGENTKQKSDLLDEPMAALLESAIQVDADGSYTVTVDGAPAGGRVNHMQSAEGAKVLMIRDTFTDWEHQKTQQIQVRRVGGPVPGKPRSEQELACHAADLIRSAEGILFRFKTNYFASSEPNALSAPWLRGGGFAASSHGRFELGAEEAWLVTLDPLGARGLGFGAGDPWMVSCEHVLGTGSLNNNQAMPNKDGTYTYVLGPDDPGVYNWVNTGGLHDGTLLVRWLDLPKTTTSMDAAVREVRVVKISDLDGLLPAETLRVSTAQRRALNARRAFDYARRYES
jgi:hypothetical protein